MNREFWERIQRLSAEADDRSNRPTKAIEFLVLGRPDKCESPIERYLAAALAEPAKKWGYEVIPQFELGRYRYDFAIKSVRAGKVIAVVECDGREFHSSPDQLANDADKDRLAKAEKLALFRIRGTEICKNAQQEANEIIFSLWPR